MFDFVKNLFKKHDTTLAEKASDAATKVDVKPDSKAFELNANDWKSVLQHAVLVSLAAGAGALATNLGGLDLGAFAPYGVLVIPAISSALLTLQRYLSSNK